MVRYLDNIFTRSQISFVTQTYSPNPLLQMDIYSAIGDTDKNRACVVWCHGGGGTRASVGLDWQRLGYVVAAIDYRGTGEADFTEQDQKEAASDLDAALGYLVVNAGKLGINPNLIITQGISAGALTCIQQNIFSANRTDIYFQDQKMNQSNLATRITPKASGSISGAANKSFQRLIKAGIAPQFFESGESDNRINYSEQVATFQLMQKVQPLCTQISYDYGHSIPKRLTMADLIPKFYSQIIAVS